MGVTLWKSVALAVFMLAVFSTAGFSGQILLNGGFESGTSTGWTVTNQLNSSGTWYVSSGTTGPASGHATAGPKSGSYYAVVDQTAPGAHALIQSFTLPQGMSAILSFDMFANNWNATTTDGALGLDFTRVPNQHARVDLLTGSATAFDTGAGVLRNFYLGADTPNNSSHAYTHYVFDITPQISQGGTFQIRFADVETQFFFNVGVDNVVIDAVPEPGTIALMGGGLLLVLAGRIRRKIRWAPTLIQAGTIRCHVA